MTSSGKRRIGTEVGLLSGLWCRDSIVRLRSSEFTGARKQTTPPSCNALRSAVRAYPYTKTSLCLLATWESCSVWFCDKNGASSTIISWLSMSGSSASHSIASVDTISNSAAKSFLARRAVAEITGPTIRTLSTSWESISALDLDSNSSNSALDSAARRFTWWPRAMRSRTNISFSISPCKAWSLSVIRNFPILDID